jgi:hypothetical protein
MQVYVYSLVWAVANQQLGVERASTACCGYGSFRTT